jgi:hypothetical protein
MAPSTATESRRENRFVDVEMMNANVNPMVMTPVAAIRHTASRCPDGHKEPTTRGVAKFTRLPVSTSRRLPCAKLPKWRD